MKPEPLSKVLRERRAKLRREQIALVPSPEPPPAPAPATGPATERKKPGPKPSVPSRKVLMTAYVGRAQMTVLRQLSYRTKVPVSEYIRQGIDMVLAKESK